MKKILQLAMLAALPFGVSAQTFHVEQFGNGNGDLIAGSNVIDYIDFSETGCGAAKLMDNDMEDAFPAPFKPVVYVPRSECGSQLDPIDMTGNLRLGTRISGATGLKMRFSIVTEAKDAGNNSIKISKDIVLSKDFEFEEFNIDFNDVAKPEGFDPSKIVFVFIELDRSNPSWPEGLLYIDYMVLGDTPTNINKTSCGTDVNAFGDGVSSFYIEKFDDAEATPLTGDNSSKVIITNKSADGGYVTIKDNEGELLGKTQPIVLSLKNTDGVDISPNQKVILVAKPYGKSLDVRIDLKSNSTDNTTNGCAGRVTKTFPAGQVSTMEYFYQDIAFEKDIDDNAIDKTTIEALNISFPEGDGLGADSVDFYLISLGESVDAQGIFTAESNQLALFPNPAQGAFQVNTEEAGQLTIANQYGQVLNTYKVTSGATKIDINNLENGFYIVTQETTSGKKFTTSLIKQ